METLQRTANRGSISTGYDVNNSVKLQEAGVNSEFFIKNPLGTPTSTRQLTFSTWVKKCVSENGEYIFLFTTEQDTASPFETFRIFIDNGNKVNVQNYSTTTGNYLVKTYRELWDTSCWYHILAVIDTTNSTSDDRFQIWINGVRETNLVTNTQPTQNFDLDLDSGQVLRVNSWQSDDLQNFYGNCYLAETAYCDGQVYTNTDFGEFDADSGIWKPIDLSSLTYGSNGFYMKYENAASMAASSASSGITLSVQNVNQNDQALDTPTNNFATFNTFVRTNATYGTENGYDFSQGMTYFNQSDASVWSSALSTIGVMNGKWYAEFSGEMNDRFIGICVQENSAYYANSYFGYRTDSEQPAIGYSSATGNKSLNGSQSAYGNSFADNDIISVALDLDNQFVYFAKNGTWQNSGDPTSGSSGTGGIALSTNEIRGTTQFYGIGVSIFSNVGATTANFGGFSLGSTLGNSDGNGYGDFSYAPPTGYYALCSKNLAEFG